MSKHTVKYLADAIGRLADKVQEMNPGADLSDIRADIDSALDDYDPTPWCLHCGSKENCTCVIADNH